MTQPEIWLRYTSGAAAFLVLAVIFGGILRGLSRPAGRSTGAGASLLRSRLFYLVASAVFFGGCWLFWRPIPLDLMEPLRAGALAVGALLYFPGLLLVLWGRLALRESYNVSTSFGARLFAGHRLITTGPYARVRHPMYLGLVLAALGGLLIYLTWTTLILVLVSPGLIRRARREETVLQAEFGEEWSEYKDRVPGWIPRLHPDPDH